MNTQNKLIKSKKRVDDLGEVFTKEETVDLMLNNIHESYWINNKTFLEPTCGNGNFLVKILEKKVKYGHSIIDSLSSTYGIDIMRDNVIESRKKMLSKANDLGLCKTKWPQAISIIKKNIICGDIMQLDLDEAFKSNIPKAKQ